MENLHIDNIILNLTSENKPNWAAEREYAEERVCDTTWGPFSHLLMPVPYSGKLEHLKTKNTALQIEWEEEENRHEHHLSKILSVCLSNSLVAENSTK